MNYDSIIIEMLSRIQKLELELADLKEKLGIELTELDPTDDAEAERRFTTKDIKDFVEGLKDAAKENGQKTLTLISGDIHKLLKLKRAMPMVCNAMRQAMREDDEVIHETPSGQSSTLEIKYELEKDEPKAEPEAEAPAEAPTETDE